MELKPSYKQTEVGVIPEDWTAVTLEAVTTHIGDGLHGTPVYTRNADYYFINGNNLSHGKIIITPDTQTVDQKEFAQHQKPLSNRSILMSINGTIGNLGLFQDQSLVLGKSAAYLNVRTDVSKLYVYYVLQSSCVRQQFFDGLTGSTIGNLGLSAIRSTYIPLPLSDSEQASIAKALGDADDLLYSLDQLLIKKRSIKQAAMQELLTGKRRLPGFEGEWEMKKLGDTASLKARIGWQGLTTAEYLDSGDFYLVTGTEIEKGRVSWHDCHYVDEARYKQDKFIQLRPRDVLVTKDGTIGKIALVTDLPGPATLNSGIFVIRPTENSFNPEFFYYLLCSQVFSEFLGQLAAGSTINHLYQKDFVSFSYRTPPANEEQAEIASTLNAIDGELIALQARLDKTREIKQGMMQDLLAGRIRLQ